MKVIQQLVPESNWALKCPYSMIPEFVVVHNTANDASARNEISYMIQNTDSTSFHYAVDDNEIVQGVLENRTAWHAGDGMGIGNRKGIGIEICYSKSGGERFAKAENLTADLIADLLRRYGWGIEKVTKHQDYSGKYCPHRTLDLGWERFLNKVKARMGGLTMSQYEELKQSLQNMENRINQLESKMIYNYIDDNMPQWAKPTIEKLVKQGLLLGDENGNLGLTEEMLRIYVTNDRAGMYGE